MRVPADIVFRIHAPDLFGASRRAQRMGLLLLVLGAPLLVVGLVSTGYGMFAVGLHTFAKGDPADVLAGVLVVALCTAPLVLAALLLHLGARRLGRAARLRELSGLAHGRTHVTMLDLAARSGRAPAEMLALLALAQKHAAAWRL